MTHAPSSAPVAVVLNVRGVLGSVVDALSDIVTLAPERLPPVPEFNVALGAQSITSTPRDATHRRCDRGNVRLKVCA